MEPASTRYTALPPPPPPPPYEELSQTSRGYISQRVFPPAQNQQPYHPASGHRIQPGPSNTDQQWTNPSLYPAYTRTQQQPQHQRQHAPHEGRSRHSYLPSSQRSTQWRSSQRRPCVIPPKEITKVFGGAFLSPFVRARAPELEQQYGLPSSQLLAFIDGLNEAFMANPALQVTNTIGTIVGFVPLQSTQILGASLNAAAGLGTAGVSIVRTKQFLKKANETIFRPKGLHAQICKTEKMLAQIGMAGESAVFARGQVQAMIGSLRADEPSRNAIARRMEGLGDRVMGLSFEGVEAPVVPDSWMKKVGSFAAQRAEKKQLEKLEKQQCKADEKSARLEKKLAKVERRHLSPRDGVDQIMDVMDQVQSQIQSLDPDQRGYGKQLREMQRNYRQLERKLELVNGQERSPSSEKIEKHVRKHDAKAAKRESKEAGKINKIYWILITPAGESPLGDDDWASDDLSEESVKCDRSHEL